MSCKSCGSKDLVIGDTYDGQVCSNCGAVDNSNNYTHHFGGISGPQGTFVHLGTAGVGTDYSYKERKLFQSDSIIKDITYRLDLTGARATEVKDMVEKVTEGEFGLGEWFSVLVGACSCIIMRSDSRPLLMSEVADVVCCDLYEMGKMISRVVQFLGIQMPEFDIIGMSERMIRNFSGFEGIDTDKLKLMVQQGNYIIQCTIRWCLTTGRRPGPIAVAVLVFVAKLNGILVKIEEVAKEASFSVHTCKKRYNELLEVLVKVAQKLPWGKDVNVNNIYKNAPFVFKYIELKSREKVSEKKKTSSNSFDMEQLLGECLVGTLEYTTENDSQRHNHERSNLSIYELENLKISHETLAKMYSKFTKDVNIMRLEERGEPSPVRKGQSWSNYSNLSMYDEWWTGRSELCKRLMREKIKERDVAVDMDLLPPSYIQGCEAVKRRKKKIEAAKSRISLIARTPNKAAVCLSDANKEDEKDSSFSDRRKRRKTMTSQELDWEDFIIESLLLHQVKEEKIEMGHYNTLLDLHVFNSGVL